jgi:hypothetical protein
MIVSRGSAPLATASRASGGFSVEAFLGTKKQLILRALENAVGNQSAAAVLLDISRQGVSKFLRHNPR